MTTTQKEQLINHYITSYNNFDIDGMLQNLDDNIRFENIANGQVNMTIVGLSALKQQAEQAVKFFDSRQQTVTSFNHQDSQTGITIDYFAVLAIDFPNGLKKGDELRLQGKSIFTFSGDKIASITDIS